MRWLRDERGSAAAEFAVAVPAILIVLVLGVGALGAGAGAVRAQQAAADAARLLGRGEDEGRAFDLIARAGATGTVERRDGLVCVTASVPVVTGLPEMSVRACALDGGR